MTPEEYAEAVMNSVVGQIDHLPSLAKYKLKCAIAEAIRDAVKESIRYGAKAVAEAHELELDINFYG